MTASLRLLRIEARRSFNPLFVPVILAGAYMLANTEPFAPFLWGETDRMVRKCIQLALPVVAGVAAWRGGLDRRRETEDLLASTPRSEAGRRLTVWGAVALWALLSYGLFIAFAVARTALAATWGGPSPWPYAIAALALGAHAAGGLLIGWLLPGRFTAPLVGVGAWGVQQWAGGAAEPFGLLPSWVQHLAVHSESAWAPVWQVSPYDVSGWQALFYGSVLVAALGGLAVRGGRHPLRWAPILGGVASAAVAVVMFWGSSPGATAGEVVYDNLGRRVGEPRQAAYVPLCVGSPLRVCMHPAYEPVLREGAVAANRLAAPLLGLPGAPSVYEPLNIGAETEGGSALSRRFHLDLQDLSYDLVSNGKLRGYPDLGPAQVAIRSYLYDRVREHAPQDARRYGCTSRTHRPGDAGPGYQTPATCAATERFAALPEAERRAWLERHYAELRAGRLTLEDLP